MRELLAGSTMQSDRLARLIDTAKPGAEASQRILESPWGIDAGAVNQMIRLPVTLGNGSPHGRLEHVHAAGRYRRRGCQLC